MNNTHRIAYIVTRTNDTAAYGRRLDAADRPAGPEVRLGTEAVLFPGDRYYAPASRQQATKHTCNDGNGPAFGRKFQEIALRALDLARLDVEAQKSLRTNWRTGRVVARFDARIVSTRPAILTHNRVKRWLRQRYPTRYVTLDGLAPVLVDQLRRTLQPTTANAAEHLGLVSQWMPPSALLDRQQRLRECVEHAAGRGPWAWLAP